MLCLFPYFTNNLGPLLPLFKKDSFEKQYSRTCNEQPPFLNIKVWWLFIGGSFSGETRAPPPPPLTVPKTKTRLLWAEICSRMHHLKPQFKNYCRKSAPPPRLLIPGLTTVIRKQHVLLGSGQAG